MQNMKLQEEVIDSFVSEDAARGVTGKFINPAFLL
jgi:hypothetical protein